MGCLGLHSPEVTCPDCGTPKPCLTTDFYDWLRLRDSIAALYRGDITDHCGHDFAVTRTAAACGVSRRFVVKTLQRMGLLNTTSHP